MLDETFKTYQEWHTQDKSTWGEGDWQNEPDQAQWISKSLPCLIIRNSNGNFCAYIGVPATHPYYNKHHDDVVLYAHGNVNFSGKQIPKDDKQAEDCDSADSTNETVWWFGFSCDHVCDYQPAKHIRNQSDDQIAIDTANNGTYRNIHYVMCEVETLVGQLASVK